MAFVDPNTVESAALDKILPNDSRAKSHFAEIDGWKWHYLEASPKGPTKGTVFLVHGFPDISLAWRYQIPMLLSLGLRCIAIDCMGYGKTGASDKLSDYSFKTHATAIAGIAAQVGASRIVLGGHDWGGAVVYRTAQWYPELVSHVFSVATPYFKVTDNYVSPEMLSTGVPQFGYQLQFGSSDEKVEKGVHTEPQIRKFLTAVYGGRPASGRKAMTPEKGVDLDMISSDEQVAMTPLLDDAELDFYVTQFVKNGMHGPCNWYRTRKVNFEDEMHMPKEDRKGVTQPTLFIQCLGDSILTPKLSVGMEDSVPNLTRAEVPASHWGLWHTPKQTNEHIRKWIENVFLGGKSKM